MDEIDLIPEFSHVNWYLQFFLKENPQWIGLFQHKPKYLNVAEKSPLSEQSLENLKQDWQNFSTQNEQLALFLKNTILPLLSPQHPMAKILQSLNPKPFLNTQRNLFPDKLISPQAQTCWHYPHPCNLTRNLTLESSSKPDILFVINNPIPPQPLPKIQTVLIMENQFSWLQLAPGGKVDIKMIEKVQADIGLISKTINDTSNVIKSQKKEYTFKRIPLPYHPLVEDIIDHLGFPPLAGIKLKSELLTDYLIVIWDHQ